MGREKASGPGALVAAIEDARRELKATWAEAREEVRWLNAANGTDELEAAITGFLRSHRKLVGAGERLQQRLARLRRARKRISNSGRAKR